DIVSRSLRLLRVLDSHEAPQAQEMADSIVALNAMVQRWEANGMTLGWSPVSNPADTLPAPVEAEEAIVYNLAVRLRPEFGATLDQAVLDIEEEDLAALGCDVQVASPIKLAARTTRAGSYNIYTDEFN